MGKRDVSTHSSSLSRSAPVEGNLFTLMDTFVRLHVEQMTGFVSWLVCFSLAGQRHLLKHPRCAWKNHALGGWRKWNILGLLKYVTRFSLWTSFFSKPAAGLFEVFFHLYLPSNVIPSFIPILKLSLCAIFLGPVSVLQSSCTYLGALISTWVVLSQTAHCSLNFAVVTHLLIASSSSPY